MRPLDPMVRCRGFMVDWGLFVLAARWSAASRFSLPRLRLLLPRFVLVVLPSLPSRGVTLDFSLIVSAMCL